VLKLYSPYGARRRFNGHETVTLHFFVKDRSEPVVPYPKLILGYSHMTSEQKASAEATARELFTEEEYFALRNYLSRKRADLRTGMLIAPFNALKPGNELGLGFSRPLCRRKPDTEGGGFFALRDADPEYDLPFDVWAYYTDPQIRA
jgi:hypothetical protein